MIDIYDEVGYIKEVLENGVSAKWERDAILLIRYYKMMGDKKSEAKQKIREKCENSQHFHYDHLVSYQRLNKIVDTAWKKEIPLREIKSVEFTKEVLNWFLSLEDDIVLSDEEIKELKERRPKVSIKKNHPINWNRTKYLFTLFIWTKVQENYLDKPNLHYLKQYNKRFQEDADLKPSFNMQRERDLLYDLGFININYALGIDTIFMKNFDVFNIPITDENRVVISSDDLYHCGYWLEKQKMGSFVCKRCGKEFAHYSNSKQEKGRKYCKECAKELKSHTCEKYCIDCGKKLEYDSLTQYLTKRCPICQSIHDRELTAKRVKKSRENKNVTKISDS